VTFSVVFTIGLFQLTFLFLGYLLLVRRVNQEHYAPQECVGDSVSKLDSNDSTDSNFKRFYRFEIPR
jgi:hypothetical protein